MSVRTITEESSRNLAIMDVFSKLVQERIIFIDNVIDDELANGVIAQLLYLDSISKDEISIYINSPGGSITSGLAIYDTCEFIKSPIKTVATGLAASMGAILMLIGDKRLATKRARIMLHQPSGGYIGKSEDFAVYFKELEELKNELYTIVKNRTSIKNPEEIFKSDKWYSTKEALKAGIITEIL